MGYKMNKQQAINILLGPLVEHESDRADVNRYRNELKAMPTDEVRALAMQQLRGEDACKTADATIEYLIDDMNIPGADRRGWLRATHNFLVAEGGYTAGQVDSMTIGDSIKALRSVKRTDTMDDATKAAADSLDAIGPKTQSQIVERLRAMAGGERDDLPREPDRTIRGWARAADVGVVNAGQSYHPKDVASIIRYGADNGRGPLSRAAKQWAEQLADAIGKLQSR